MSNQTIKHLQNLINFIYFSTGLSRLIFIFLLLKKTKWPKKIKAVC